MSDRLAIDEMIHLYAEAVDVLGCHPVRKGKEDPVLSRAAELFGQCMTETAAVRLFFEGPNSEPTHAPSEGPEKFAEFVRAYFTGYGYIGTYHLVGNIRTTFTGPDTASVGSLINSTHWTADGRMLFAPIVYDDRAVRHTDGTWKLAERELVVQRWWVTDGYFPVPTDPSLARPTA
jgi:SnoaL-like protein